MKITTRVHVLKTFADADEMYQHSKGRHNLCSFSPYELPCLFIELRDDNDFGIGNIIITQDTIKRLLAI